MKYDVARKLIESRYDMTCTVYEYQSVKGEDKITKSQEVAVLSDQPCRISYENINSTNQSTGAAEQSIITKLFISPDIEIKAGCKISVTKGGKVENFQRSGRPAKYATHQEIMLTNFERWA